MHAGIELILGDFLNIRYTHFGKKWSGQATTADHLTLPQKIEVIKKRLFGVTK